MRNPFAMLDGFLVRRVFMPLAQEYEARTGHTQYKLGAHALVICTAINLAGDLPPLSVFKPWSLFWDVMLLIPISAIGLLYLEHRDKQAMKEAPKDGVVTADPIFGGEWGAINKGLTVFLLFTHALSAALLIDALFNGAMALENVIWLAGLYFVCMPRPPKKARKEEKFNPWARPVPVGNR